MVGDKPWQDIKGAKRVGIKAVLKRGKGNSSKSIDNDTPEISSIAELPDLIRHWMH